MHSFAVPFHQRNCVITSIDSIHCLDFPDSASKFPLQLLSSISLNYYFYSSSVHIFHVYINSHLCFFSPESISCRNETIFLFLQRRTFFFRIFFVWINTICSLECTCSRKSLTKQVHTTIVCYINRKRKQIIKTNACINLPLKRHKHGISCAIEDILNIKFKIPDRLVSSLFGELLACMCH